MSDRPDMIPLVLAGGKGTRLAGVCADRPKPAVPVAGRPFLAWILDRLWQAGFDRAVVSGGHLADVLAREVGPTAPADMALEWLAEPRPLGTAGGMAFAARASRWSPDRWLVMNGDSYLAGDWPEAVRATRGGALVAHRLPDASRYGAVLVAAGRLGGFAEKGRAGPGLVNAGIYAWPAAWLAGLSADEPASLEVDVLPRWLAAGREITVVEQDGPFIDIGTPESLAAADGFMTRLPAGVAP